MVKNKLNIYLFNYSCCLTVIKNLVKPIQSQLKWQK